METSAVADEAGPVVSTSGDLRRGAHLMAS